MVDLAVAAFKQLLDCGLIAPVVPVMAGTEFQRKGCGNVAWLQFNPSGTLTHCPTLFSRIPSSFVTVAGPCAQPRDTMPRLQAVVI